MSWQSTTRTTPAPRRGVSTRVAGRADLLVRLRVTWLCVIAAIPVVAAVVRQIVAGWVPEGDSAIVAIRIRDVFTGHPPLQGMRSTSGMFDATLSSHHPGPLEFYLDAPVAALTGYSSAGFLIAVALVNVACVVGTVILAHRMRGLRTSVPAVGALLLSQWLLGPDVLASPLNPCAGILPLVLMLVAFWAVLDRDPHGMWVLLLAGSFAAQTELAFCPLVVFVGVAAGLVAAWRAWRATHGWQRGRVRRRPGGSRRRRLIVGGVLLLAWLPPIIELFVVSPNNLQLVLGFVGAPHPGPVTTGGAGGVALTVGHLAPTALARFHAAGTAWPSSADIGFGAVVLAALLAGAIAGRRLPRSAGPRACWVVLTAVAAQSVALAAKPDSTSPTANFWLLPVIVLAPLAYAALVVRGAELLRGSAVARRAGPGRLTRVSPFAAGMAALVLGAVLASVLALAPATQATDRARVVSNAVLAYLRDHSRPGTPVRINGLGLTWIGLSPAVGLQVARDGRAAYCLPSWPYPEDTDSSYATSAPPNSIVVTLADPGSAGSVRPGNDTAAVALPKGAANGISVWVSIPTVDRS